MNIVLEGFSQGASSGTWRVLDGGAPAAPLAAYTADGRVSLLKTGHTVDKAALGEGLGFYYGRVAAQIGGDPNQAGAVLLMGDTYNVGHTGDPILDLAVHVDAFANPTAYGLGSAGAPPVAGAPNPPGSGPVLADRGGPNIDRGLISANGANSSWQASNPEQVQYVLATQDGLYSAVCDNSVPVYGGVGFPPGVATFADLKGAQWGTGTSGDVTVKAGQYFCFVHDGASGNKMRCSGK